MVRYSIFTEGKGVMYVKKSIIIGGSALILLVVAGAAFLVTQQSAVAQQDPNTWQPKYVYAAKFVCGLMKPNPNLKGEPPVKPANYATDVNIHNPQEWGWPEGVRMLKKVVEAIPEPDQGKPLGEHEFRLFPDGAASADCNEIYRLLGVNPSTKPFKTGFFVIKSEAPLDVVGVYTSATGPALNAAGTVASPNSLWSISEDIEYIPASTILYPHAQPPQPLD